MANLTLAIEDELLKQARRLALERDTTVNQMVREYLENAVQLQSRRAEARLRLLSRRYPGAEIIWKREDLYER